MNNNTPQKLLLYIPTYGILAALLAVLQTTLIPRIEIFDCMPDVIIGAVCCVGIYRGEITASVFGLFSALCVEGLGSTGLSLLPLFYVFAGYICGRIGRNARANARFVAFLITIPPVCLGRLLVSVISYTVSYWGTMNVSEFLLGAVLPEYIFTLLLCIPAFLTVKLFESPMELAGRKGGWL